MADKGGATHISTAMRVLAEIIASDVSLLVTFNHAIDAVIPNNPKARANPSVCREKLALNRTADRLQQESVVYRENVEDTRTPENMLRDLSPILVG